MALTVAELNARLTMDTSNFEAGASKVAGKAEESAGKASKSFGTFISGISNTGIFGPFQEALVLVQEGIDKLGEHASGVSGKIQGIGLTAMAVGGVLASMGSKDQAALNQLKQSVTDTGESFDTYKDSVEKAVNRQADLGRNATETYTAIRTLYQATGNMKDSLTALAAASDLAAARHMSLADAATQLAKAHDGSTSALKGLGLEIEKAGSNQKTLTKDTGEMQKADEEAAKAKQKLDELEARLNVTHAVHIASITGITNAQNAEQKATEAVTKAEEAVTAAKEKLITKQDAVAIGAKAIVTHNNEVVTATAAVTAAEGRLEAAHQRVTDATNKISTATDLHAQKVDALNQKQGLSIGKSQELANAQAALTAATDKAAAMHQKFGDVTLKATGTEQAFMDNVAAVTNRLNGQDSAAVDTFTGKIKVLATHAENAAASFGAKYGPAIMGAGALMTGIIPVVQGMSAAFTAFDVTLLGIEAPIGAIVLVIAGIGIAVYELYQHWNTVWSWIKNVLSDVRGFFDQHFALFVLLMGPGSLLIKAIEFLSDHWRGIWDGIQMVISDVWGIIKPIIDTMTSALKDVAGPISTVLGAAGKVGGAVGGAIGKVFGFAEGGVVPGPKGSPTLAVVHGGEAIIPPGAIAVTGGGGSVGNQYTINLAVAPGNNMTDVGRIVVDAIRTFEQKNGRVFKAA